MQPLAQVMYVKTWMVCCLLLGAIAYAAVYPRAALHDYDTRQVVRAETRPPTIKAESLADTTFEAIPGYQCPNKVVHHVVSDVPVTMAREVEGIIAFDNITVDGESCALNAVDPLLRLVPQNVLIREVFKGKHPLRIQDEPYRSVFLAGFDGVARECMAGLGDQRLAYIFTAKISHLLPDLIERGLYPPYRLEGEDLLPGRVWMLSFPISGDGERCLFRETFKVNEPTPVPEFTPASIPDADDEEAGTGDEADDENESNDDSQAVFPEADDVAVESEGGNGAASCFPAFAKVQLKDGTQKEMDDVHVGDRVMVAAGLFSEVFMFTHKLSRGLYRFLEISLKSGDSITVTPGHYIYVNGYLTAAKVAVIGDTLELDDGSQSTIVAVRQVTSRGLFNPQTIHGDLVVDGVRSSTYTSAVEPLVAHALLTPLRAFFSGTSISTSVFDNGADELAYLKSYGQQMYSRLALTMRRAIIS